LNQEIKLKLKDIRQFYNSFDPAPFRERDLDPKAVEYIVDCVKEHTLKTKISLLILVPNEQLNDELVSSVKSAIKTYFDAETNIIKRKFKRIIYQGRKAFMIGIFFLVAALSFSELINSHFSGFLFRILSEGLFIASWVGLWYPISVFLYDWWPIVNERKVFEKIRDISVKIKGY